MGWIYALVGHSCQAGHTIIITQRAGSSLRAVNTGLWCTITDRPGISGLNWSCLADLCYLAVALCFIVFYVVLALAEINIYLFSQIVVPFFSLLVKDIYFLNEGCVNR
jgi:hypothetical protein